MHNLRRTLEVLFFKRIELVFSIQCNNTRKSARMIAVTFEEKTGQPNLHYQQFRILFKLKNLLFKYDSKMQALLLCRRQVSEKITGFFTLLEYKLKKWAKNSFYINRARFTITQIKVLCIVKKATKIISEASHWKKNAFSF